MENHDIDIRNLQFTSEDTGSFFSKTYTEYNWKFVLDGVQRSITLYHSKILGRRTIFLGKQEICKYQRYTYNFQYSFPIETHSISIVQSEDSYILKIDEVPFNKLLNEQKLRRFNIIKDTFLENEKPKTNKSKKEINIKKFLTYNRGSAGIPISRRGEDRKNMFKTNIDNSISNISDVINNDNSNEIDTSTNKNNINDQEDEQNNNEIALNQYYDGEEISDDISNMAIDGGDSDKDEDEDENVEDEKTIQESFRPPANDDILNGNEENEDDENNINNINNINDENNINNEEEEDQVEEEEKEKEEDEEEEKDNKENYNNINNELLPIKSNRSKNSSNKVKIKSKRDNIIHNIDNNIDDENNINNINNINNNDHIDLLGEEIYNSSRDKNLYNNLNNVDNNLNINYILSQKEQKYSNYKSNNPSNPFEDDSINTN